MNANANATPLQTPDHIPWSRQRWTVSIVSVFLLQCLLLGFLSNHQGSNAPSLPLPVSLNLVHDPWSSQQLALMQTYRDPTLFALPNIHGFSGGGWLKYQPMEHHFREWSPPAHWLDLPEEELGETFHHYLDRSASSPMRIADKPFSPRRGAELLVPILDVPNESRLTLSGGLADRAILSPTPLRSWESSNVLTNTVIRAVVDDRGQVYTAALSQSCGLPKADHYAMELVQSARFNALPASPTASSTPVWGQVIFQWHTLPLADNRDTNTPSP